jgi:hypothetical protein
MFAPVCKIRRYIWSRLLGVPSLAQGLQLLCGEVTKPHGHSVPARGLDPIPIQQAGRVKDGNQGTQVADLGRALVDAPAIKSPALKSTVT